MTEDEWKKWFEDCPEIVVALKTRPDGNLDVIITKSEKMYQAFKSRLLYESTMTPEERAAWVEQMVIKKE